MTEILRRLVVPLELAGQALRSSGCSTLARVFSKPAEVLDRRRATDAWGPHGQGQNPDDRRRGARAACRARGRRRRLRPKTSRCGSCTPTRLCSSSTNPQGSSFIPGAGNRSGTLQNALLNLDPSLEILPRAGHHPSARQGHERAAARCAHARLAQGARRGARAPRAFSASYRAVCQGVLTGGGTDRRADRPPSARAHEDGRRRARSTGRDALSRGRAVPGPHPLRSRARDGAHSPDSRAHGPYSRAARGRSGSTAGGRDCRGRRATICVRTLRSFRRQALHASSSRVGPSGNRRRADLREPVTRRSSRRF